MELSRRLYAVASLVTEGASVADIGTDHGYVPVYLIQQGIASKVLALDINDGPLKRAERYIAACGLKEQIEVRKSDGLLNVRSKEVDTVIAAGMGGALVIKILSEGKEMIHSLKSMILQPQSELGRVRAYINQHGLRIVQEEMVEENGKYYPMMQVIHGAPEPYEEWEYLYGKRLLEKHHPVLYEYLRREIRLKEDILRQLTEHKKTEKTQMRIREITCEIEYAGRALACYGGTQDAV